jgi:CheY-like chemotaxis protein
MIMANQAKERIKNRSSKPPVSGWRWAIIGIVPLIVLALLGGRRKRPASQTAAQAAANAPSSGAQPIGSSYDLLRQDLENERLERVENERLEELEGGFAAGREDGSENLAPQAPEPTGPRPARAHISAAHILIADGDSESRSQLAETLTDWGFSVACTYSGEEALERVLLAEEEGQPFNLAIFDPNLPHSDGIEAARAIRILGIDAQTMPIIALQSADSIGQRRAARAAGIQASLEKPVQEQALADTLNRWLAHRIIDEGEEGQDGDEESSTMQASIDHSTASHDEVDIHWQRCRSDALMALEDALQGDLHSHLTARDLSCSMHQLADVAGLFGEIELSEGAADLVLALRNGDSEATCRKLARTLLACARERPCPQKQTATP